MKSFKFTALSVVFVAILILNGCGGIGLETGTNTSSNNMNSMNNNGTMSDGTGVGIISVQVLLEDSSIKSSSKNAMGNTTPIYKMGLTCTLTDDARLIGTATTDMYGRCRFENFQMGGGNCKIAISSADSSFNNEFNFQHTMGDDVSLYNMVYENNSTRGYSWGYEIADTYIDMKWNFNGMMNNNDVDACWDASNNNWSLCATRLKTN